MFAMTHINTSNKRLAAANDEQKSIAKYPRTILMPGGPAQPVRERNGQAGLEGSVIADAKIAVNSDAA